jgi:hypothetical protein
MKQGLTLIGGLAIIIVFIWGGWALQRKWNYSWGYESMVKQTIREMVKEDALRSNHE